MAAPPEINILNLAGKWTINKSLTDDLDAMFVLQGLSWFVRKAISLATVVLTIKEYQKGSMWHIDITSVASGVSTTQEDRTLDYAERDHPDKVFGAVKGKSRLIKKGSLQMEGPTSEEDAIFLRGEKLKDMSTASEFVVDDLVQSWAVSVNGGWTVEQIWGFEIINGERRYTRRIVCRKGAEIQRNRLVYDYKGPVPKGSDDEDLAYGE